MSDKENASVKTTSGFEKGEIRVCTVPSKDDQVIGYNHARRSDADKQRTEALLSKKPPKVVQKVFKGRFVNSIRLRYLILVGIFALAVVLFIVLWAFDETKVGFAVGMCVAISAFTIFWIVELLIRCPLLGHAILYHIGAIEVIENGRRPSGGGIMFNLYTKGRRNTKGLSEYDLEANRGDSDFGIEMAYESGYDDDYSTDSSTDYYDEDGKPIHGDVAKDISKYNKSIQGQLLQVVDDVTNITEGALDAIANLGTTTTTTYDESNEMNRLMDGDPEWGGDGSESETETETETERESSEVEVVEDDEEENVSNTTEMLKELPDIPKENPTDVVIKSNEGEYKIYKTTVSNPKDLHKGD